MSCCSEAVLFLVEFVSSLLVKQPLSIWRQPLLVIDARAGLAKDLL
jgi:hypothetical protein